MLCCEIGSHSRFNFGLEMFDMGLEGEAAKVRNGFGGDQRDKPAGARATGGCCYGDQRGEIRGDFT